MISCPLQKRREKNIRSFNVWEVTGLFNDDEIGVGDPPMHQRGLGNWTYEVIISCDDKGGYTDFVQSLGDIVFSH